MNFAKVSNSGRGGGGLRCGESKVGRVKWSGKWEGLGEGRLERGKVGGVQVWRDKVEEGKVAGV